ncbi:programmed cell death protein [Clydaea vesicula]|uniref:Programmed cell death protein n=1 Tax=Clydaea vesicula TaxID=447962 RepID=A0AAD5TW26_9FUNG|nr:programmed cell death protein [Clydaea vesicula]KAJ3387966.1 programmed cell death protein [Lobulomyces angularis]
MSSKIQLGFAIEIDENDPLMYDINDFPSKIGGLPMWLNPAEPLTSEQTRCEICNDIMAFLLQIYNTEDFPEEAFNRSTYVFICRNENCNKTSPENWNKIMKVFRIQLPKKNPYYPFSEDEPGLLIEGTFKSRYCKICNLKGSKCCSKCKNAYYCSKEHQLYDWNNLDHKLNCSTNCTKVVNIDYNTKSNELQFNCFEIVNEVEPESKISKMDLKVEEMLNNMNIMTEKEESFSKQQLDEEEETKVDVDKAFLKFQKRVEREPEQAFRYYRTSYNNTEFTKPLYVSDLNKPKEIPDCKHCHSKRTLEYQVMPQLLNFLQDDNVDFGTLLIYTCESNCESAHFEKDECGVWARELIFRQDFSNDGMKLGNSSNSAITSQN